MRGLESGAASGCPGPVRVSWARAGVLGPCGGPGPVRVSWARAGSGGEAVTEGVADKLGTVARAGLGQQVVDVALDGRAGNPELGGDLGVGQARADLGEHLA